MTAPSQVLADLNADGSRIAIHAEYRWKDMLKSIPGSSWDRKAGEWTVPLSWSSCLTLRESFQNELVIQQRLFDWATDHREKQVNPALALRDALTAPSPGNADLYAHQQAGVEFMVTTRRCLLGDEPGVGKTAQAIRALKRLSEMGVPVFPVLVVGPNSMKKTWQREIEKWWPMSAGGPDVSIVAGTPAKRRKAFEHITDDPDGAHVIVMNWESLRGHSRLAPYGGKALKRCVECGGEDPKVTPAKCQVHERELNRINFNAVVADEVHRAKDPSSQQSLALQAASGRAAIRFGLTGTYIDKDPTDLWSIFHWLRPEEFPTKSKWIDRFVDYTYNVFGGMVVTGVKPQRLMEFQSATDPFMRRMTKAVVLPFLPEVVQQYRYVDMVPQQEKAYKAMLDNLMARIDDDLLVASNPMVQTLRLMQFASAYGEVVAEERVDEATGEIKEHTTLLLSEPSGKLDAFMEDVFENKDFGDQPMVVFAQSKQLIDLLSARMNKKGVAFGRITGDEDETERQKAMDDFQAGRTKYILCTIAAGGTGITLTAASVMVFLQRSWSRIEMTQAENRAHRIGSEVHDSIMRVDYVVPDTVEMSVIAALEGKSDQFEVIARDRDLMEKFLKGVI